MFQMQVFATSALGCRHDQSYSPTHCAYHLASPGDAAIDPTDAAEASGCVKCDLAHALQLAPGLVQSVAYVPYRSEPGPAAIGHFYRHCTEPFLRPPNPILRLIYPLGRHTARPVVKGLGTPMVP